MRAYLERRSSRPLRVSRLNLAPMTKPERHALYFLAAVGLLGAGVRVLSAGGGGEEGAATGAALAAQLAAVDSAIGADQAAGGRRGGGTKKRRGKPAVGHENAGFASPARPGTAESAGPLDLDRADAEAMEALPGIGPALAARIVASRDSLGAFGSVEGLTRVRGIGPAVARRLAPMVTFSGIPRPANAVSSGRSAVPGSAPGTTSRRRGGRP